MSKTVAPEKAVAWRNRRGTWTWAFVTPTHTDKHGRAWWRWLARMAILRAATHGVDIEWLD